MTSSEKHDCLEALYEELSAIQHTMNISRCWAGNGIACRNLDRREAEIVELSTPSDRQSP